MFKHILGNRNSTALHIDCTLLPSTLLGVHSSAFTQSGRNRQTHTSLKSKLCAFFLSTDLSHRASMSSC